MGMLQDFERLEQKFSRWTKANHPVACATGSAALHLALETLELPPDSEVLVPEFAMIACARAVILAGLKPVFVDCGPDLLMDLTDLKGKITANTKAIMPVHIYGRHCDMKSINSVAKFHNLYVVEDYAEAHGIRGPYESDAQCWSFYRNKIVAGEEGGVVAFKRKCHSGVARYLRCHGFRPNNHFLHEPRGMNYRLSNAHAKLIAKSLNKVERNLRKRAQVSSWYDEMMPNEWMMPKRQVHWVHDIRIQGLKEGQVETIVDACKGLGLEARCGFKPMSIQPEFYHKRQTLAQKMSREVLYLPINPNMSTTDCLKNVDILQEAMRSA